jgi:hypothetical protein
MAPPPGKKAKLAAEEAGSASGSPRVASPEPAFKRSWSSLTAEELASASTLGLDVDSWPTWITPSLLPVEPGEDEWSHRLRSFSDATQPGSFLAEVGPVLRHGSATRLPWDDLDADRREAAARLGYTPETWEAFHAEEGMGVEGWCMTECPGDSTCWSDQDPGVFRCGHGCEPVQCPNFIVCEYQSDGVMIELKGRCLDCDIMFGENFDILDTTAAADAEPCPICMDEKAAIVKLPQCRHRFCGSCVRTLYDFNGGSGSAPHMQNPRYAARGGSGDKGCPLCREGTLPAAWDRRFA